MTSKIMEAKYHTYSEIMGQPELWIKTYNKFINESDSIKKFIDKVLSIKNIEIILTGAGTSSYIGDVIQGPLSCAAKTTTHSISTTDIVTHPEVYFSKTKPQLLISFARSGNSPESRKVIELAELINPNIYHFIITCNEKSKMLNVVNKDNSYIFFLPKEANDKSLAMTGSFTSMLLTGLLLTKIKTISSLRRDVEILAEYGKLILTEYSKKLKEVAKYKFDRAVFLASSSLKGVAKESHLKLQELTDGKVICKYDTFLGFRHGPKAVVNNKTLIVFLFSNNKYVNKYETDLVNSFSNGRKPICTIGVMEQKIKTLNIDLPIIYSSKKTNISEEFLSIVSVLPAQLLGFYKSIDLGFNPDSPSANNMISRVVQGVKLYPYNN